MAAFDENGHQVLVAIDAADADGSEQVIVVES